MAAGEIDLGRGLQLKVTKRQVDFCCLSTSFVAQARGIRGAQRNAFVGMLSVAMSGYQKSSPVEPAGVVRMVKEMMLAAAIVVAAINPGFARNYALPEKNPIATVVIPDSWDVDESDFGYSATSPDEDFIFTIESASASRVDKLIESNLDWMHEQEIVPKAKAVEEDINLNGVPAKVYSYKATDPNGDTLIEFVMMPGGNGRVILLTLWGSEETRADNKADISTILLSIKAIN